MCRGRVERLEQIMNLLILEARHSTRMTATIHTSKKASKMPDLPIFEHSTICQDDRSSAATPRPGTKLDNLRVASLTPRPEHNQPLSNE